MTEPLELSLIIPAFNEALRLPGTLERLRPVLDAARRSYEVLVVDDGSTDTTAAVTRAIARGWPALSLLRYDANRGKGCAVRTGMLCAAGSQRVLLDADGSTPPSELPKLLAPLCDASADVVIGSRYVGSATPAGQPRWRVAWSRLCNALVQSTLLPGIADPHCGFKAFSAGAARDLFADALCDGWAYDIEVLALARRKGYRVLELPVAWRDDRRSRVRPLRDLGPVLAETLALYRRLSARSARARSW